MNGPASYGPGSAERAGPGPERTDMTAGRHSPVAVVGTLAEFRRDPTTYDLASLVRFVREISPDLLCLDMTLDEWQHRDFGGLPAEYRDALLPLADQTDIVVVPIGDGGGSSGFAAGDDGSSGAGLRHWLSNRLHGAVASLQLGAPSPVAVDQGARHWTAELLYHAIDWLNGGSGRHATIHREALATRIVELARRDSGRRVLVVVNARYCHYLRAELRRHPEIALVRYPDL